ncbi:MAG: PqqD family protein [Gemmatimonadota bacterium]
MASHIHPLSRTASVVATSDQVSADLDGEVVILHLGGGEYFGLDEVAARVWELISSPAIVGDIEQTLLAEYDVEASECRNDLDYLLASLDDRGLIEIVDADSADDS